MRSRKVPFFFLLSGLLLALSVLFAPAVYAQCGSEASTCKDCHEVQGQDPVNNDGTNWHESHAFGDFCYICHAGNQQATTADAAHQGMEAPLADIKASCQSCHPGDLEERATVYAEILGVSLEGGGVASQALATLATTPIEDSAPVVDTTETEPQADSEAVPDTAPVAASSTTSESAECAPMDTQIALDDPNLIDYAQHYNQVVLGEQPVNWGNVALIVVIGLLVLGGGGFMVINEVRLNHEHTVKIEGEYPADVVDLLPELTNLKAQSRKSLKRILNNPQQTDRVLGLIDAVVDDETKPDDGVEE